MAMIELYRAVPPWVIVRASSEEDVTRTPMPRYGRAGVRVEARELRGQRMRSMQGLMGEFAAALQFFDGFGANWRALKESLSYLDEWMPAEVYIVLITSCHELLIDADEQALRWLIVILNEVGAFWAQPIADGDRFDRGAVPFHTILTCPAHKMREFQARLAALGVEHEFGS
jgi:hypothetical protein